MRWTGAGALVVLAVTAALALRVARLDVRPMHHDEANQAVKFGALLEHGEYRYDAHDHHGPTLYFLSLPAAWLRGQTTLASLDERTLRGVTAVFGAATILLLPALTPVLGRAAVAAGAMLVALSPAMVFYSRMFIQESLFAFFTLAFVIAVGRVVTAHMGTVPNSGTVSEPALPNPWTVPTVLAGVAAGLAAATKETSALVLPAALLACAVAWRSLGPVRPPIGRAELRWIVLGLAVAAAVAALFYSSFLTFPAGVLEPFLGIGTYLDRGVGTASHAHPWHYYLGLLASSTSGGLEWTEGLVLGLAAIGGVTAWALPDRSRPARMFWTRYFTAYAVISTAVFSAIPYKTPWNLLPFYVGMIVVAGVGFSWLLHATSSWLLRAALVTAFVVASGHLGWQAWRASVTYAADPRNPYVYSQTVPDTVRMATRIRHLAALHRDGMRMQVSVIAQPYEQWPLPWYLRTMPHVGYWSAPGDALALQAPVLVASTEHAAALEASLADRYVSEFYGLRPDVLLTLYIERGLWNRFLARQNGGPSATACPDNREPYAAVRREAGSPPGRERCGGPTAMALWRTTSVP